jgi:putative addiction module CopG family antidote
MSVTLTSQLEALIRRKVDSGLHRDAESVVSDALRLLDGQDRRLQRLRATVAGGDAWTPELMERLTREVEEMIKQGIEPDPDVSSQAHGYPQTGRPARLLWRL